MTTFRTVETAAGSLPVVNTRLAVPARTPRTGKPHLANIGVTGTQIQQGMIFDEEFNSELTWKEGLRTWDAMRRTETQISSTLQMIGLPIRSAAWKFQPGTGDPLDVEKASFAETCLFHTLLRPWDNVLRHALIHLWAGFMDFEQTFRMENGRTILNDLAPRLPRTVNKWLTDPQTNELLGIQQWAYRDGNYVYLNIPADALLHFANQQEGQNYEGISILRTAYKPYWYKQTFEKLQAIGFEREHVGIPIIKLPDAYNESDILTADKIGKNLRSHEQAYVALPNTWEIDWLKSSGAAKKGTTILDTLYYLDRQMQQNVLAQFMSLGTTDVGSYALSNDQSRVFLMALQAVAGYIADVINTKTVKKLIDYNYPATGIYPKLIYQKIHAYNFVDLTTSIANLVATQVIPISAELEEYVYDMLGVPIPPRTDIGGVNPMGGVTPIYRPDSAVGPVGGSRNESAGGIGFNEVYQDQFVRLSGTQAEVYARMAHEIGRPTTTLRLGSGAHFASAPKLITRSQEAHDSTTTRRLQVSETARREAESAVEDLTEQLEEILGAK